MLRSDGNVIKISKNKVVSIPKSIIGNKLHVKFFFDETQKMIGFVLSGDKQKSFTISQIKNSFFNVAAPHSFISCFKIKVPAKYPYRKIQQTVNDIEYPDFYVFGPVECLSQQC